MPRPLGRHAFLVLGYVCTATCTASRTATVLPHVLYCLRLRLKRAEVADKEEALASTLRTKRTKLQQLLGLTGGWRSLAINGRNGIRSVMV